MVIVEKLPADRHLVHGDVQLKNVMISSGEIVLIDMDKICAGSFLFEFASLFATYMAFNEDEPDNTLRFLGIGEEMAARIYRDTLRFYLRDADEAAVAEIEKKIRALGYLRFLTILAIEMKDVNTPLKDLRIRNTAAHLRELARQIDSFEV